MDRALLDQIWPVFSAEAREHLEAISSGLLALEEDPGKYGVLDGVRRTAHSLKGSAGSLGLLDVERLAHAIEGSLAGFDPAEGLARAAVEAVLDAVLAIEEALATGDSGGTPRITALGALLSALGAPAPAPDPERGPEPERPAAPAASPRPPALLGDAGPGAVLEALEATLELLCSPVTPEARKLAGEEAAAAAARLAEAGGATAPLARRIAERFAHAGAGGAEGARAAAALAGDVVELREALEHPAEGAAASAPSAAPAPADKSIRVLASTLESLARQLELLALGEARHARRAREVRDAGGAIREALRALEPVTQALRAGEEGPRAALAAGVSRLRAVASEVGRLAREGHRDAEQQRLAGAVLREDLRALRMVPAAVALEPLRRAVRDVAGRLGKDVELVLAGGDVKLDRRIVDELRDPLLHLVRNAVDHGVEDPAARRAAGKPARGRVSVQVEPRGNRVGIVVEDDGAGLDVAAVRASAVAKGLLAPEAAARLPDAEAARLVFHPGLSTAQAVTEISGRGVGLDVVNETATRLQGTVDVSFTPGAGTRFDLEVPLTLAATAALLFRAGRDLAALPADAIERVLLLTDADVGTVAGRPTVAVGKEQVPFAPLSRLLGLPHAETRARLRPALVVFAGGQRVVVGVEEVLGQQDVVVSSLGARAGKVTHLAGAGVLDDGRVVGVLAAIEIARRVLPSAAPRGGPSARPRVVVADDSLTTRSAMKALLEIAGYAVLPAADGEEAYALLGDSGAQLVVSDVQMPRLDGLALTRRIKADPRLRAIPVVLVTSLEAPEDRAAGMDAGADGYLVKREVERGKLVELVRQLLPART